MNKNKITDIQIQGTISPFDVLSYRASAERMEGLVESGIVYKRGCGQCHHFSISILCLEPRSKIAGHMHMSDSETYTTLDGQKYDCPKGHGHSLQNTSYTNWLVIISVKAK